MNGGLESLRSQEISEPEDGVEVISHPAFHGELVKIHDVPLPLVSESHPLLGEVDVNGEIGFAECLALSGEHADPDLKHSYVVTTFNRVVYHGISEQHLELYSQPPSMDQSATGFDRIWPPSESLTKVEKEIELVQGVAIDVKTKGYSLIQCFMEEERRELALEDAIDLPVWDSLPRREFLEAYLGQANCTKFAMLVPEDGKVLDSEDVLQQVDRDLADLCRYLVASELLGGSDRPLDAALNAMVRVPFEDDAEEGSLLPTDVRPEEQTLPGDALFGHLNFLKHREYCLMYFVQNSGGFIDLIPLDCGVARKPWKIPLRSASILVFNPNQFTYRYAPKEGRHLLVQTWIMSAGPIAEGENVVQLPAQVSGEQVWVTNIAVRLPQPDRGTLQADGGESHFEGMDCVRKWNEKKRFELAPYYCPDPALASDLGLVYTKHAATLNQVAYLDPKYFRMNKDEVMEMPSSHRHLCEVVWEVTNNANVDRDENHDLKRLGLFLADAGMDCSSSLLQQKPTGPVGTIKKAASRYCARSSAAAASRLAYILETTGPCNVVDTGDSSGLVAVYNAHVALRQSPPREMSQLAYHSCISPWNAADERGLEIALPIGVNILYSALKFLQYCSSRILSAKGRCFSFDKSCDGYARGEACVALLMRRGVWEEYTVTCSAGAAANQDGRTTLVAPFAPSQEKVIRNSLEEAQFHAAQVTVQECHAIGSPLGDPIEASSLRRTILVDRGNPVMLGSSKTSFGHSEVASGLVGLYMSVLALLFRTAMSNNHLRELNFHAFAEMCNSHSPGAGEASAVRSCIPTDVAPLNTMAGVAGVSSFGSTGTNAYALHWVKSLFAGRVWTESDADADRYFYECASEFGGPGPGPKPTDEVYIIGSWDTFQTMHPMERLELGMYRTTVKLDSAVPEEFQLVLNKVPGLVFHPHVPRANENARVVGPDALGKDKRWRLGKLDETKENEGDDPPHVQVFKVSFTWRFSLAYGETLKVDIERLPSTADAALDTSLLAVHFEHKYYVCGSATADRLLEMQPEQAGVDTKNKVYTIRFRAGPRGQDQLQILRNGDPDWAIYPKQTTSDTDIPIRGPDGLGREKHFILVAPEGDLVTVRLAFVTFVPAEITVVIETSQESGLDARFWRSLRHFEFYDVEEEPWP